VPRQTFESVYIPLPPGAQRLVHLDASSVFPLPGDGRQRSFAIKNISFENLTQTDLLARGWHKSGYLFDIDGADTDGWVGPALALRFPTTGRFHEAIVEVVRFPSRGATTRSRVTVNGTATSHTLGLERPDGFGSRSPSLRDTSVELHADPTFPLGAPDTRSAPSAS
jgi:hypothetical protein